MKKDFLRILAALLLAAMLLSSAACTAGISEQTTDNVTEVTTEAPVLPVDFSLTADYVLLRPDEADKDEIKAIQLLSRGIKSACGFTCSMLTDFKRPTDEIKRSEFEILVGKTNRPESEAAAAELAYYDWKYEIISENVILICGGSAEATLTAVGAFLKDCLGYEENAAGEAVKPGQAATLQTLTEKEYSHDYPITSLKLGDRDATEFTLVAKTEDASGIKTVVEGISRVCGKNIPVVAFDEFKGGPAIYYGCGRADGEHSDKAAFGFNRYYVFEENGDIFIDFRSKAVGKIAAERFVKELLPNKGQGEYTVELEKVDLTGIHVQNGTNGLELSKVSSVEIENGIVYEEHLYLDKNGAPVRAYVLIVANGAGVFETSMPSDNPANVGKVSNIKNQLNSAKANGKKVVAGINADFFDMGGTNIMRGLCIKDGQVLHGEADRPWFGITDDGRAVMGTAAEYGNYRGKLKTAVGGSHVILRNDSADNIAVGTEFADTRHPRTAVGVKPDGSVVLMVVDGRQPEISNGASLADMVYMFGLMGCSQAINLDGGGSSTFILEDAGSFVTKNSPSAGSLRAVANGLMVVLP